MSNTHIEAGWEGRFYENVTVGDVYKHPYGRTVTETDDVWFTNPTMNVNGTFILALAAGMSVMDVSMNATANLGDDDIRHHSQVSHGDTIFAESKVLSKRESESRDHVGMVTTELRAYNQNNDLVLSLERTPVLKRENADVSPDQPPGWPEGVGTQQGDSDD
ncbi:MaoC family dehydratase [Haloarculaceae archaeon H-GB11]|nr:MaoC family dehydratase [Haloarculaceae archaeon H-GB11]